MTEMKPIRRRSKGILPSSPNNDQIRFQSDDALGRTAPWEVRRPEPTSTRRPALFRTPRRRRTAYESATGDFRPAGLLHPPFAR